MFGRFCCIFGLLSPLGNKSLFQNLIFLKVGLVCGSRVVPLDLSSGTNPCFRISSSGVLHSEFHTLLDINCLKIPSSSYVLAVFAPIPASVPSNLAFHKSNQLHSSPIKTLLFCSWESVSLIALELPNHDIDGFVPKSIKRTSLAFMNFAAHRRRICLLHSFSVVFLYHFYVIS